MAPIEVVRGIDDAVVATLAERGLWRYNHRPVAAGQPCFHPVNTPSGYTISLLSPWDHIHHCALWFAWKLVDGVNAWEGPAYPPHEPMIVPLDLDVHGSGFAAAYQWQRRDDSLLLTGLISCDCLLLADGAYALDLDYRFVAPGTRPVLLDRNPPPDAGYAGLSIRLIREFRHARYLDADGRTEPPARGTPVAWHAYAGPIDGGPQRRGGVALMDHPRNQRFPTPTYTIHESEAFGFLQCAFLYQGPYELRPDEPLRLRYRVVVFDGEAPVESLRSWFDRFAQARSGDEPTLRTD
jgi:hypothetical protein